MELWTGLLDILILLSVALLLGGIAGRFGQSPILGYLLAGTLLGPNALDLLPNHIAVSTIAELGVALLLFSIGLEFSWRRLRAVGRVGGFGGTLQVLGTLGATVGVLVLLGMGVRTALALGAVVALSSTAAVMRLLAARSELDAVHGRQAVGVLLLQDVAVVPLVLLVSTLGGDPDSVGIGATLFRKAVTALGLVVGFHLLLNRLLPVILRTDVSAKNRDMPVLLAMITVLGAAWVSHWLGFSPVLGAFIAGLLLGESPFATQIRADVAPLQVVFMTLFFSSIGMLSNPAVVVENWALLALAVGGVVFGKAAIAALSLRAAGSTLPQAIASGLVLAQLGEFSLVLADSALEGNLLDLSQFEFVVAALMLTLFVTPFMVSLAPSMALRVRRWRRGVGEEGADLDPDANLRDHLVIVGFGPAGQRVAELTMGDPNTPILVLEMNQSTAAHAESYGLPVHIGNAMREEVLEHARIREARAVAITLPDPLSARQVVRLVRALAPEAVIAVRSRYHIHRWQLVAAGAHIVVDEEDQVGVRIAAELKSFDRGALDPRAGGEGS
jgi:CPA2 family monovalent cation:H+ antiporter-2